MHNPPVTPDRAARRVSVAIDASIHFGRGIIAGVANYARERGHWSLRLDTRRRPGSGHLERLAEADGMIYQYEEGMEPALARLPIPLLNISAHALPARLPSLHADARAIGRVAAEHLLARGHDRLAAMVDPAHAGAGQRGEAFLETVRAAGARGEWVEITPGREDFADWLAAHPGRWGVFAFTDEVGRALLEAAREVGRPVPESLAVVGVFVEEGEANDGLDTWLQSIEGTESSIEYDVNALLPAQRSYYTYGGSLTTPPCSEIVRWVVLDAPITASSGQLDALRDRHDENARPVQPLGDRSLRYVSAE